MSGARFLRLRLLKIFFGIILGLETAGCGARGLRLLHSWHFSNDRMETLSDKRFLDVPFYPDNTDQCGPSALASVIGYWGHPVDLAALRKEIYLVRLKGSLPIDLMLAAENRGYRAHMYSGSIDDLKSELRMGHPLIAFINRGFGYLPMNHYVVINGYDEARQGLTIHSGKRKDLFISYRSFLSDWDKTHRSTLLILPSEHDKESPHAES